MISSFILCLRKFAKNLLALSLLLAVGMHAGQRAEKEVSLKKQLTEYLCILCDDLRMIQDLDRARDSYGALYCTACSDRHSRAAESVLPFTAAYKERGDAKYLESAIAAGNWLIQQQRPDGSWVETPSDWTGTTTDQLLSMSAAYPILKEYLTKDESRHWLMSIKQAADWIVGHMDQEFATINYCATSTASLMTSFQLIHDSAYVRKAHDLAGLVVSKFDQDFFLTGEGNRIRGTKYGIDPGYNMDMSLWGLGLYAKLSGDLAADSYVRESLNRQIFFIYPDGSVDYSWGVRASKWITYGSFTADGCQPLLGLYAHDDPKYATAALANAKYFMSMNVNGLLTYGQNYYDMFNAPPCIYPTFCRAKSLALALIFGDPSAITGEKFPSQTIGWSKYFRTIDVALVRTKNFMATVSGYRYKDIRKGAEFKYMFRPSGGSITNLWAEGYGYVQASSQTEYHRWETNFPQCDSSLSITPRIEFTDSNGYYTNLFEFDSHMELTHTGDAYVVEAFGELKDRNRWEGGVAYSVKNIITDAYVEKNIVLRFHGQKPVVTIVEPFIRNRNTKFTKVNPQTIEITGEKREFIFEVLDAKHSVEAGTHEAKYRQPFPSLKGYPLLIRVTPEQNSIVDTIRFRISFKK